MTDLRVTEALRGVLRELPERIGVHRIDRLWLFNPMEIAGKESGLVVLSLRDPEAADAAQRLVVTWRYEAERVRNRVQRSDLLAEQGWAPADRVPRVIEGVLKRLKDDSENPIAEVVEGSAERWEALLERLGVAAVDPAQG